ncbi:MAG: hypothetical protein Q9181_003260 [Wetmoreana brouardii]
MPGEEEFAAFVSSRTLDIYETGLGALTNDPTVVEYRVDERVALITIFELTRGPQEKLGVYKAAVKGSPVIGIRDN